ncbi:hypothetical protein LINPERPRIM_LOCUS18619 [Linum perenne]
MAGFSNGARTPARKDVFSAAAAAALRKKGGGRGIRLRSRCRELCTSIAGHLASLNPNRVGTTRYGWT